MNIPPMFSAIITARLATLHELQTIYSYEDALDMAESLIVKNYNTWHATEQARKK